MTARGLHPLYFRGCGGRPTGSWGASSGLRHVTNQGGREGRAELFVRFGIDQLDAWRGGEWREVSVRRAIFTLEAVTGDEAFIDVVAIALSGLVSAN